MQTTRFFRALVIADALLLLAGVGLAFFEPELPEAVDAYLEEQSGFLDSLLYATSPPGWQLWLYVGLAVGYLLASVASLIGIFLFKRWARAMFVAVTASSIAMSLFMGGSFASPLMGVLDNLLYMCDGALVALMLTHSVRDRFGRGVTIA